MARSPVHPRWSAFFIGIALALTGCAAATGPIPAPAHPPMTTQANMSAELVELYQWAAANRDKLAYIPCTCGCRDDGHTSNADCFVKDVAPDGKVTYDKHARYCGVCRDIARDTRRKLAEGMDLSEIRHFIDSRYQGNPTDTPYPPPARPAQRSVSGALSNVVR